MNKSDYIFRAGMFIIGVPAVGMGAFAGLPAGIGLSRVNDIKAELDKTEALIFQLNEVEMDIFNAHINGNDDLILFGEITGIKGQNRLSAETLGMIQYSINQELANKISSQIADCEKLFDHKEIKSIFPKDNSGYIKVGYNKKQQKSAIEMLKLIQEAVNTATQSHFTNFGAHNKYISTVAKETGVSTNSSISYTTGSEKNTTTIITRTAHNILNIGSVNYDEELDETYFYIKTWRNNVSKFSGEKFIEFDTFEVSFPGKNPSAYEDFTKGNYKDFKLVHTDKEKLKDTLFMDMGLGEK